MRNFTKPGFFEKFVQNFFVVSYTIYWKNLKILKSLSLNRNTRYTKSSFEILVVVKVIFHFFGILYDFCNFYVVVVHFFFFTNFTGNFTMEYMSRKIEFYSYSAIKNEPFQTCDNYFRFNDLIYIFYVICSKIYILRKSLERNLYRKNCFLVVADNKNNFFQAFQNYFTVLGVGMHNILNIKLFNPL